MSGIKIAVVGAGGRMGRMIIESTLKDGEAVLVAAVDQPGAPWIGKDAGELVGMPCNVAITTDVEAAIAQADCLIDFTRPQGTLAHIALCRKYKTAIVIGTTGIEDDGKRVIAEAAKEIPVVFSSNMSVGANTMFKLTYQAYIMFGIMMAYILVSFTVTRIKRCNGADNAVICKGLLRCPRRQVLTGIIVILLLISTCGYLENAIIHWFGGFPKRSAYQTLNATNYLENAIPDDAAGIRWLNDNVNGQPVVLEASGDSYKDYDNRVSAMTGLPTVLGWYVHEWLWRNNLEEENQRKEDVQTIYTSSNAEQIKSLIEKYKISYLFIGSCEVEKYGEINSEFLTSLGKVVFRQGETMIIEVFDGERGD